MKSAILGALAAMSLACALPGAASAAGYALVNVDGKAQPWLWEDGGLNTNYQFGAQDGGGPAVFDFATLGIVPGQAYGVLFIDGMTSAFDGVSPDVGNGGYTDLDFGDDQPGSTGTYLPSFYLPGEFGPRYDNMMVLDGSTHLKLNSLVGTFSNSGGEVLQAFSLGRTGYNLNGDNDSTLIGFSGLLGAGFTHIQFGLNDDLFADNSGSLRVCIDHGDDTCFRTFYGGGPAPAPEPGTWALAILGFGLAGAALRRRRAAFA